MSKTVEVLIPEEVVNVWGTESALAKTLAQLAVVELVREQKLSVGKASELQGIPYWEMMEILSRHDVPFVNFSEDELNQQAIDWTERTGLNV